MAGVAGRSGGHNRRSNRQHQLAGTHRPDRHGRRPTADADAFEVLTDLRDRHLARYRRMDARLTELEARPVTPDASRLLRALRAEAQLIAALTVQRVRFAQDEPRPEPDDPFAEFDASIDGWIRRGERRRAAEGKDGQEQ